jgi:arginase
MINRFIVPYLMGQRRDGLGRLKEIDSNGWTVLAHPDFKKTKIDDRNEQIRRMEQIYLRLSETVRDVVNLGHVPVTIAGDCVSTLGMLGGLQKAQRQPDRILWLDAHGDFHTWDTTSSKYIGGMPLAMLVGRKDRRRDERAFCLTEIGVEPYPENQIILSDARDLDPGEKEAIQESKITQSSIYDVIKHISSHESLYVHWDTDVVCAESETPALKYHVGQGPSYADIATLFRQLCKMNVIAVSVSAWHEEKDHDNRAAMACLTVLRELGI